MVIENAGAAALAALQFHRKHRYASRYVYTSFRTPLDLVITSRWTRHPKLYPLRSVTRWKTRGIAVASIKLRRGHFISSDRWRLYSLVARSCKLSLFSLRELQVTFKLLEEQWYKSEYLSRFERQKDSRKYSIH